MASSGSVFSKTLQDITTTKLEELAEQRHVFEKQYQNLLEATSTLPNQLERLIVLVDGVKSCLGVVTAPSKDGSRGRVVVGSTSNVRLETDLKNLDRFLEQARYDPSVSFKVLGNWEKMLLQYLSVQSAKYQYADLYGRLVTEWLSSEKSALDEGNPESGDSYEELPGTKKLEARTEWEKVVFESPDVDRQALLDYLNLLFGSHQEDKEADTDSEVAMAINELRREVASFESDLNNAQHFSVQNLHWVIRGLEASDLLSNEKREVLKDFLGNRIILGEIADVLNMRMATLNRWSWGDHVPLEERRNVNGGYTIQMHEDLLQAIFLHYIGVKWSVFFKTSFISFRRRAWKKNEVNIPKIDRLRREYYTQESLYKEANSSLQKKRRRIHKKAYFFNQLIDYEGQVVDTLQGEEEAEFRSYAKSAQVPRQSGGRTHQTAAKKFSGGKAKRTVRPAAKMAASYDYSMEDGDQDDEDEDEDEDEEDEDDLKNPMKAKQKLLHILSTEIVLNTRLHGELTCFRSVFESWNPLLPHETILTVLEFFGVSDKWRKFFKTFLQAPLKFMDDKSSSPRLRRRGTPGSHALSDVFGEVVLCCLDFSVNQATDGEMLYRLYDDIWFWSKDYTKCAKAWTCVKQFTDVMSVEIDDEKTGSVRIISDKARLSSPDVDMDEQLPTGEIRWGFLYLDGTTGRFEIDEKMVTGHIEELRMQLKGKSKSVIDWIQTWNTYAAVFFSSNFGKPANCFGREHVDKMLATHRRIQEEIFQGGNVVQFLKQTIEERFQVKDVPEGFLFFPVELGGLDLKSPFVGLLQIRESVKENPYDFLDEYEKMERKDYFNAKAEFERGDVTGPKDFKPAHDTDVFFPFAEYIAYREQRVPDAQANIVKTYKNLMRRPEEIAIDVSVQVKQGIDQLSGQSDLKGIKAHWGSMEPYWRWVAQMYGPEMCERFGGLNIVDPGLLPIGMVGMFREKRITWQE